MILRIRLCLTVLMLGLLVSGVTAFPIQQELHWLLPDSFQARTPVEAWLVQVRSGLDDMYGHYPWIAYGTDWLAYAHLILAVLFLGPLRDPVRNRWVIEFGLLACLGVLPLALICGPLRGIPWQWRLVDGSFGVLGAIPTGLALYWTCQLELSLSEAMSMQNRYLTSPRKSRS